MHMNINRQYMRLYKAFEKVQKDTEDFEENITQKSKDKLIKSITELQNTVNVYKSRVKDNYIGKEI